MISKDSVGKRVRNIRTGAVATVISFSEEPSTTLSNGIGFCIDSPISRDWVDDEEEKKTLSDEIMNGSPTTIQAEKVKQAIKEFLKQLNSKFTELEIDTSKDVGKTGYNILAEQIFGERLI